MNHLLIQQDTKVSENNKITEQKITWGEDHQKNKERQSRSRIM